MAGIFYFTTISCGKNCIFRLSNQIFSAIPMKYSLLLAVFLLTSIASAQTQIGTAEIYPQFPKCEEVDFGAKEECFRTTLRGFLRDNFQLPEEVKKENFSGEIVVIFEVSEEGSFNVIYIDAPYASLKDEVKRVFDKLPRVKPATYNARPTQIQFRMPLDIPLREKTPEEQEIDQDSLRNEEEKLKKPEQAASTELDEIKSEKFTSPQFTSQLNIPLSHEMYSRFDAEMNKIGVNTHTAAKPLLYSQVQPYYDFKAEEEKLMQKHDAWFGRKLWNEHLVQFQAKDYWFTLDFALDMQLGRDFEDKHYDFTYNNTRAAILQGGLGKNLNFYVVAYENQGRFAAYYNQYAESIRPDGGDPAIVPGRGIAKPFMDGGYDYPVAEGYLSFRPSKHFNIQLGHGKNFIGDGYRSLLLSDNATPYPYLKLNTTFWKIKYTNTWMSLRDVRPEVTADGSFRTKYMANHYLSFNASNRLNIGLFESVLWENDNNRGFDFNYLNPVIFYRAIEFSTGARGGNAIMGLSAKYKWTDQINTYGQMIIDEFSSGDVFGGEKSWKNKLGFQLGVKYYDAFKVPDLFLQLEYNQVRPYTYSHNTMVLNYGHNNQSMAHLWGANFRELVGIARYKFDRYYGSAKFIYGKRGFDYNNIVDDAAYGGDIYRSEEDRAYETGVKIGQGNTTNSFFTELEAGYLVNPATNLKLYASLIYRDFKPQVNTALNFENSTVWVNFGLRTDIFNWYYDY